MVKEQASVVFLLGRLAPHLLIKKQIALDALVYTKDRLRKRGYGLVMPEIGKKRGWSKREEIKLLVLRREGFGARAIAHDLKRSMDSVYQKSHKLAMGAHA